MPDSDRMEAPPARSQLRDRAARRLRWIVLWLGCAAPACGSGHAPGVASPLASRSDAGAPGPVSVRSLQPTEAPVGSNALTLTLTGENFGGRTVHDRHHGTLPVRRTRHARDDPVDQGGHLGRQIAGLRGGEGTGRSFGGHGGFLVSEPVRFRPPAYPVCLRRSAFLYRRIADRGAETIGNKNPASWGAGFLG